MRYKLPRLELFDEHGLEAHTVKSLKLIIYAVVFGVIQFNIVSGIAMAGYLRSLGASDFIFGLLFAVGPILSPLQLVASYLLERTQQRKKMLIGFGLLQRVVWLPLGLVPFFIPMEQLTLRIWMVSLFLFIAAFSGPFMNVTFFSLLADLVPEHIRGRYFAVRMRIFTMSGILGGIITAWILDSFPAFYSYALVFTLAAVMGVSDVLCFFGVKFPDMSTNSIKVDKKADKKTNNEKINSEIAEKVEKVESKLEFDDEKEKFIPMLLSVLKNKSYMKFIFFMTLWLFSLNISGPFILIHLREGVRLSNTLITVAVQILPNICSVIIVSRWGRSLDTHGNKAVMQVANGILCFAPFLWLFTGNNTISIVFIMLIGLMQGLLLPGFDLGANNIMLGHAPKVNRSMYIAMFFTCTSIIGIGLANATGGWLLDNVFSIPEAMELSLFGTTLTRYNYLLTLSAIMRCIMVYIALPIMVKEESRSSAWSLLKEILKATRRRAFRLRAGILIRIRRILIKKS